MDGAEAVSLVEAAAAGDQRAWDALVERLAGLVWSITRGFRLDRADAADVCQTTWLRLVEHLGRLQDPARVTAWVATTARHESLRVIRMRGRQVPTEEPDVDATRPPDPEIDARLLRSERHAALWRAFDGISARCQALLRLLAADPPIPYVDVGVALDMPVGSIGPTRARCLDSLRRRLEATGITAESAGST